VRAASCCDRMEECGWRSDGEDDDDDEQRQESSHYGHGDRRTTELLCSAAVLLRRTVRLHCQRNTTHAPSVNNADVARTRLPSVGFRS